MKNIRKFISTICIVALLATSTVGYSFADSTENISSTAVEEKVKFTTDSKYDFLEFKEEMDLIEQRMEELLKKELFTSEEMMELENIGIQGYDLFKKFENYLKKETSSSYDYKKHMGTFAVNLAYIYYNTYDTDMVSKYLKEADRLEVKGKNYYIAKAYEEFDSMEFDRDNFLSAMYYVNYTRKNKGALKDKEQDLAILKLYNSDQSKLTRAIKYCEDGLKELRQTNQRSIELNRTLAQLNYYQYDLEEAEKYFKEALKIDNKHSDLLEEYVSFAIEIDNSVSVEALINPVDKLIYTNPRSIRFKLVKYNILNYKYKKDEADALKEDILSKDIKIAKELEMLISSGLFEDEDHRKEIAVEKIKAMPNTLEAIRYAYIVSNYYIGDEDMTKKYGDKLSRYYKQSVLSQDFLSGYFKNTGQNFKAIESLDYILEKYPNNRIAIEEKINIYTDMKRYKKALQTVYSSSDSLFLEYETDKIKAATKIAKYDFEGASSTIKRAANKNAKDIEALAELSLLAVSYGDYELTKSIYDKMRVLTDDKEDFDKKVEEFDEAINESTFATNANEFLKIGYLYKSKEEIEAIMGDIFDEEDVKTETVLDALDQIMDEKDIFSGYVSGQDYERLKDAEASNNVTFKNIDDETAYIKFDQFTINTDVYVIEAIDKIENPNEKTLILDLRGNGGGLTNVANVIAGELLPECVSSAIITREGQTTVYNSLEYHTEFKEIIVLIDENTASAAELLTLSLKTYLENVTVIGNTSYGKGIGQSILIDDRAKVYVSLTTHYWNVRENNIMDKGITPDVKMDTIVIEQLKNIIAQDVKEVVSN